MKIAHNIKDALTGHKEDEKHKAKDFMKGVGHWVTSPGGISTIVLVAIAMWYAHHLHTSKK